MFLSARRALRRSWFNFKCRSLLKTPPVGASDADFTLLCVTRHGEILMSLLAIESFVRQLGRTPSIVTIHDGSLTTKDRAMLTRHLPHAKAVATSEIAPGRVPKGISWDTLLLLSDLTQRSYVVQIHPDTLVQDDIAEVSDCIDQSRAFTLAADLDHPQIESMKHVSLRAQGSERDTIQALCQSRFGQMPEAASLKYVRGDAGLIGFPKGSIPRQKIEWFSDRMRGLAQERWGEPGSRQVATDLLIANTERAQTLPALKYVSFVAHSHVTYDQPSLVHFAGPSRFTRGVYLKRAKKVIALLRKQERKKV